MIKDSVKNLFDFIDFLHSKTTYFVSKQNLIDKVMELHTKRNSLKPNQNFKDRIEYNKTQAEFEKEFEVLKKETTIIIIEKINELNIADISTPIINLNAKADLLQLQKDFTDKDLKKIFEAKRKYLDFRTKTNFHYFLEIFFYNLDRDLKEFFDYFKETTANEFEVFETKTVKVNSMKEAVNQFQKGIKSVSLPMDFLNQTNDVNAPAKEETPYSHREIMIAHEYKRKAKIAENKTANDWKKERGNACYNDYYTLQPGTKNLKNPYKKPTPKELKNVIEILIDYPELQNEIRETLKNL